MVIFTNITFDNNWIYADAEDKDYNVIGKIKVHRRDEIFETNCTGENNFKRAVWRMRREVNNGKIKQGGRRSVAWG